MANRNEVSPIKYLQMIHFSSIDDVEHIVCRHAPKPKPLGFDGIGFDQYWI